MRSSLSTGQTSNSSKNFAFQNASLQIPPGEPCQTFNGHCVPPPDATLYGITHVNGSSPLSCIDVSVNGAYEGSSCGMSMGTHEFNSLIFNGSNNTPIILVGHTYSVALNAHFEDGSNSVVTVDVTATIGNSYTFTMASTTSTESSSSG
jgi:hypothetical protein